MSEWMGEWSGYPLDCYDYQSTCGANKYHNRPGYVCLVPDDLELMVSYSCRYCYMMEVFNIHLAMLLSDYEQEKLL